VSAIPLQGITLASRQVITANATIDFVDATVSLSLKPSGGSSVPVFTTTSVPGLAPYQSRVSLEAKNSTAVFANAFANFVLDNVNVVYSGALSPGTVQFGTIQNVPENIQSGLAPITIERQIAAGFLPTVRYLSRSWPPTVTPRTG